MITRRDVLADAIDKCREELYSLAQPSVNYDDFIEENKIYLNKEEEYYSLPENDRPPYHEYMGPKPFEFYYLPEKIMREVCESYIHAYKFNDKQELLDTIIILKNYCKDPIVDKYFEGESREDGTKRPGYRGYEHPDNLEKEINKIIDDEDTSEYIQNKFFEFLDMAGNFFNWTKDLYTFYTSIYLGASPNSNKKAVIENWKKYRNQDIEIDEEKIKKDYYGDDE